MQKFIIPPDLDFVNYPTVLSDPNTGAFAIYILEFNHTFSSADLSYIWQNVQPDAGLKSVFDDPSVEASISHSLSEAELLQAEDFKKDIQWLVFKAKQRAKTNYFEKTTNNPKGLAAANDIPTPSYNWPYDFFSLIELIKVETEATLDKDVTELEAELPEFEFPEA